MCVCVCVCVCVCKGAACCGKESKAASKSRLAPWIMQHSHSPSQPTPPPAQIKDPSKFAGKKSKAVAKAGGETTQWGILSQSDIPDSEIPNFRRVPHSPNGFVHTLNPFDSPHWC